MRGAISRRTWWARGGGAIVNTSSFAFLGDYGGTGYPAGKGAVDSLTLAIAAELREHRVRANAVCPGARTRPSTGEEYERQIERLHRRGLLDEVSYRGSLDPAPPEYVARLYAYLVDEESEGVTGEILAGSGCFVGRFPRPQPSLLAWRDRNAEPPWTIGEIARFVGGAAG